jgi:hypothetical protein
MYYCVRLVSAGTCSPHRCSETVMCLFLYCISTAVHVVSWSLPSNGSVRHSAPSLRLFVPTSIQAYRHFFLRAVPATCVLGFTSLPVARFARCLFFNRSRCSLLKAARPDQIPDKMRPGPGLSPSSCFPGQCSYIYRPYSVCHLFFRFGGGQPLHNVQSHSFSAV